MNLKHIYEAPSYSIVVQLRLL